MWPPPRNVSTGRLRLAEATAIGFMGETFQKATIKLSKPGNEKKIGFLGETFQKTTIMLSKLGTRRGEQKS